jgi:hypothetical protein
MVIYNGKGMTKMTDVDGKPYAKLSELREEDIIAVDGGFDCIEAGPAVVHMDDDGRLFFCCNAGKHFLDGQCDDGEHCVGVYGPARGWQS